MILFLKMTIGAFVVFLIDYFSKKESTTFISGILPLFPSFGLIAVFVAYFNTHDPGAIRTIAFAGMKTVPAYVAFLSALYLTWQYGPWVSSAVSVAAWFAVVLLFFK